MGATVADRVEVLHAKGMGSDALAAQLAREPDVEYAVPDRIRQHYAAPDDSLYQSGPPVSGATGGPVSGQWYLRAPSGDVRSAVDLEAAWDVSYGLASVVVAVIDTGVRFDHPDLLPVAQLGSLLPGYDMISDTSFSNDGNGRDADASDPGDWLTAAEAAARCGPTCSASDSSWHGTQTSGIIAALTNNGAGMAGVARRVRVLPVRVLGKGGGFDSDIIAGMRWAAGLSVAGVPTNTTPARVLNLSLGSFERCGAAYADAIAEITAAGALVVASAGNSAGHAVSVPANCPGVLAVAALRHAGSKVGFSDIGPEIGISAPGGNCINIGPGQACLFPILTTSNSGTTVPVSAVSGGAIYTDSFNTSLGTSFAAPIVAGTAALMISANPTLTPGQLRSVMQQTARPFPTTGAEDPTQPTINQCFAPLPIGFTQTDQLQCYCSTGTCGAGMLDAGAAMRMVSGLRARIGVVSTDLRAGRPITLSAATSVLPEGHSVASYEWRSVEPGGNVSLSSPLTGSTVAATAAQPGTFRIGLTVIDNTGLRATTEASFVATEADTSSDTTPPVLNAPANINVEVESAAGVSRSSAVLTAFFNAASASDARDGVVVVANNAPSVFPFGATTVTFTARDAANNVSTGSATVTVVDTRAPELTVPSDISVEIEASAGTPRGSASLAAFLASARAADVRDGVLTVTNNAPVVLPFGATVVTFRAVDAAGNAASASRTISVVDTTAPRLNAPADVTLDAVGRLTQVDTRGGAATATDLRDGTVLVSVVGRPSNDNFAPGRTVLTYMARDAAGNSASAEQAINVNPLAQLGANQDVSEGQRVVVTVLLNGDAPRYPVGVSFGVSGSAESASDHDLRPGVVTINTGRMGTISFDTASDSVAEPTESVVLSLSSASNAVIGPRAMQTINIVEANVAPMVDVQVRQNGANSTRVTRTGGTVTASALVSDGNRSDSFAYDWSMTSSALVSTNGTNQSSFVFDPSGVAAGAYELKVRVTDSGNLTVQRSQAMVVQAQAPALGTGDSDGDGASDLAEGTADQDGDGIANFQDRSDDRELLPLVAPGDATSRSMFTEAGLRLGLGAAALVANGTHAAITAADVASFGDAGRPTSATDAQFTYNLPFFDFVVEGAAPGDTVAVVIPLPSALPSGSLSYRKFSGTTYGAFTENANNAVSSAAAVNGVCPLPRSPGYGAGLIAGRNCVQLLVQDGGPNDLDGAADGRVVDPGSVATSVPPPAQPPAQAAASSGGGGGGCAVGEGPADPTLPWLLVCALLYLWKRSATQQRSNAATKQRDTGARPRAFDCLDSALPHRRNS